jgi:hypothetical protein
MTMGKYDATFAELKTLFAPYVARLTVTADSATTYMLDGEYAPALKRPIFFGGVRSGKAYVSLYLMPIYSNPELMGRISDGLRRRLHGKSCFNFTTPDRELVEELRGLIARGFACYEKLGYVK